MVLFVEHSKRLNEISLNIQRRERIALKDSRRHSIHQPSFGP